MKKMVAIDVETTGYNTTDLDISKNHQILSIGLVVADGSFNAIDKFYCEIKYNGTSHWSSAAERVHGLTQDYLAVHGLEEADAVCVIAEFLLKHFTASDTITFLGHRAGSFDVQFFSALMHKYGIMFNVSSSIVDTMSVGYVCFGTCDFEKLYTKFSFKHTKPRNALTNAKLALAVCRKMRKLIATILE